MGYLDFHHHKPDEPTGIYNLALYEPPPQRDFSAGIHPADAGKADKAAWDWLETALKSPYCAAVGECGLDGLVNTDPALQEETFRKQILMANDLNKPLIIHCVRLFHRLGIFIKLSKVPVIVHGFNKNKDLAEKLLTDGTYLSFGKAALHSLSLQNVIAETPLEKLFLETDDACFDIAELYDKVSVIKGLKINEISSATQENLTKIKTL